MKQEKIEEQDAANFDFPSNNNSEQDDNVQIIQQIRPEEILPDLMNDNSKFKINLVMEFIKKK